MCKIDDCKRYPYELGMCLNHYRDYLFYKDVAEKDAPVEEEKPKRKRKKKIDAVEVLTTEETTELETREEA